MDVQRPFRRMAAARAPLVWTGRMAVGVAGGLFRRSSGIWLLGRGILGFCCEHLGG